jgi:hypothetical protein
VITLHETYVTVVRFGSSWSGLALRTLRSQFLAEDLPLSQRENIFNTPGSSISVMNDVDDDEETPRIGKRGSEAVPAFAVGKGKTGRLKKKLRSRAADDDLDPLDKPKNQDINIESSSIFDELEAAAGSENARDRGSREAKRKLADALAAEEAAAEAQRKQNYDHALEKANHAIVVAQDERIGAATSARTGSESETEWTDDEQEGFQQALQIARLARQGAANRNAPIEDERLAALAEDVAAGTEVDAQPRDDVVVSTETNAFLDALKAEEQAQAPVKEEDIFFAEGPEAEEEAAAREEDQEPMDAEDTKPEVSNGWVADNAGWSLGDAHPSAEASEVHSSESAPRAVPAARKRRYRGRGKEDKDVDIEDAEEAPDTMALFEAQRMLGRGLGETLVTVRERGWLHGVEYCGRQSDFKGNQQKQVEEALLSDDTALSHRVGASLQRTDEFGRILTPKEAFRDVSYAFHGYHRAASKKEKSFKKLQRDRAQSGLVNEKETSYCMSRNVSQLVDDFKSKKWRPKYVKGHHNRQQIGDGSRRKVASKRTVDRFVEQAAAAAKQEAAAASKQLAAPTTAAAKVRSADSEDADRKLMPPPPPPAQV